MKQTGYVIKEKGTDVTVQIVRATACGDKCSNCSAGCEKEVIDIDVLNRLDAKVGNYVEIESESKKVLKMAFLVYILPIIFMLAGMLGVSFLLENMGKEQNDLLMLGGGVFLFVVSMIIIKIIDKKMNRKKEEMFRMTKIV